MKIAINGFGRIGRTVVRQLLLDHRHADIEIAAINDIAPLETCAYLFRYDSVFGPFPGSVVAEGGGLAVAGRHIPFHRQSDLARLDLGDVDLVMECTGQVSTRDIAERPLRAGAGLVLVSGPCAAADVTVVMGANDADLGQSRIVSNASCTTNAVAPLLRAIDDRYGIARGHVTTIHCYTGSQPMVDAPRADLARSRAGAVSMVPTTTSATRLVEDVLLGLAGRLTGAAVRVPAISVSAIDAVLTLQSAIPGPLDGALAQIADASPVMGWTADPVVSTDLRARPESLVIALPECLGGPDGQVRIFGWYDNEWGFSARMIDMSRRMIARDRGPVSGA